jgi:hypothetical protein
MDALILLYCFPALSLLGWILIILHKAMSARKKGKKIVIIDMDNGTIEDLMP